MSVSSSAIRLATRAFGNARAQRRAALGKTIRVETGNRKSSIREPSIQPEVYLATFAINVLALALPLSILQIYDRVIPNHSTATLGFLLLGLSIALLLDALLKFARAAFLSWNAQSFVRRTENEAVKRILTAVDSRADSVSATTLINRYAAISAIGDYHCGQSRTAVIDLPFVVIALLVMLVVGGNMVLVPAIMFMIFSSLAIIRARKFREIILSRAAQDNRKYDFIAEVLSGIQTAKGMAMEPQLQRRFERLQQSVADTTWTSILIGQGNQTSAFLYGNVTQLAVVSVGAFQVINDSLSIGALSCCTMLSGQILQPLLRAISVWSESETIGHKRSEVRSLLDLASDTDAPPQAREVEGNVRVEDVVFGHSADSNAMFDGVNISLRAGALVGLHGDDGSGRTTLLRLLYGDLLPTSGRVLIDEVATSEPEFQSIRPRMIYVGPTPTIFRGTILENLTLFRHDRRDLALDMAKLVGLEATINLLPGGFETALGEGAGDDLPPSIAQQLCIARALVCRPRILALDDINSVMDLVSEKELARVLQKLRGNLTIFVVTHRPSLLALCDHNLRISGKKVTVEVNSAGA